MLKQVPEGKVTPHDQFARKLLGVWQSKGINSRVASVSS
jgi:hypothetical protein